MFKYIKSILKVALPAMGEMILYMLIWLFDTMMIGRYGGQQGVAAVGLSSEIIYTFINILIGMGISVALTSIISRNMGANEVDKASENAGIGIKIGIVIAIILSIIFFVFAENILKIAGAEESFIKTSVLYMKICSFGIFFNMCSNMINSIFRGCKNTKIPLYGAIIMNLVNIFLDYVLIFGKYGFPQLGIKGAAIATATAHILCFIFILNQLKKLPFKISLKRKVDKIKMKEIVKLAIPSAMQEGASSISRLLGVMMVMMLGSLSFSANQITITIESISFMPGWGLSIACTALVGHSIGEKKFRRAKDYANASAFLSVVIMGFFSVIFLLFSEDLISLFMKKDEIDVITLGSKCLVIGAAQQIPMAVDMVLAGALKGSGDTKTPFKIAFLCNWFIRLPLMYYFIYIKKMPITYFWYITVIQWTIEGVILTIKYQQKFRKMIKEKTI